MNARTDRLHHASNESEASLNVTATLEGMGRYYVSGADEK